MRLATRAFVAACALLAAVEVGVRIGMPEFFENRYDYGFAANAGLHEQPDGRVELTRSGGRKFYPQSFPAVPPPGTLRIVTVGDSIARGATIEQAFPGLLAEALTRPGRPVESINLSVPGYGARRKLLVMRQVLHYRPAIVILQVGASNEFEDERDARRARDAAGWHPGQWLLKSYVVARLHEYILEYGLSRWLPPEIREAHAINDADDEARASLDPQRQRRWLQTFDEATDETLDALRASGATLIVVPRVHLETGPDGRTRLDDDGLRARLAPRLPPGSIWIDPRDAFGDAPDPALFGGDRVHWKPDGHRRIAALIAARIDALAGSGARQDVGVSRPPASQ